ncbi:MAG: hypothetical protein Q4B45_09575 [Coriobacteriia bacterium]|nr:hypothetical protein [Coriobacteriia bacterium]
MADEKKTLSDEQLNDVTGGRNIIPPLIMSVDTAAGEAEAASLASEATAASLASTLADEPSPCIR